MRRKRLISQLIEQTTTPCAWKEVWSGSMCMYRLFLGFFCFCFCFSYLLSIKHRWKKADAETKVTQTSKVHRGWVVEELYFHSPDAGMQERPSDHYDPRMCKDGCLLDWLKEQKAGPSNSGGSASLSECQVQSAPADAQTTTEQRLKSNSFDLTWLFFFPYKKIIASS